MSVASQIGGLDLFFLGWRIIRSHLRIVEGARCPVAPCHLVVRALLGLPLEAVDNINYFDSFVIYVGRIFSRNGHR